MFINFISWQNTNPRLVCEFLLLISLNPKYCTQDRIIVKKMWMDQFATHQHPQQYCHKTNNILIIIITNAYFYNTTYMYIPTCITRYWVSTLHPDYFIIILVSLLSLLFPILFFFHKKKKYIPKKHYFKINFFSYKF